MGLLLILLSCLLLAVVKSQTCTLESSTQGPVTVDDNDDVTLRQIANPVNGTITIELTYAGLGWVSFALNTVREMIGPAAVIGLPDDDSVAMYRLSDKSLAGVELISDEAQQESLTGTSIVQNDTHTVLTFTRPLEGNATFGEPSISTEPDAMNGFIFAVGKSNELAYHSARGFDTFITEVCGGTGGGGGGGGGNETAAPAAAPSAGPPTPASPTSSSERSGKSSNRNVVGSILSSGVAALVLAATAGLVSCS